MENETGKIYNVNHSRKGKFTIKVESQNETWLTGTIMKGFAMSIKGNVMYDEGEKITIRKSLCDLTKLK